MSIAKYVAAAAAGAAGVTVVRRAGSVRKQNSPFRRFWERHLLATLDDLDARAKAGEELPLLYVALGDSAAQGLGADAVDEGYVPRVAEALAVGSGREVAVLNLSLSGGTVQSVLGTQLPQLAGLRVGGQPLRPDVVTLDIGGNDVGQPWFTADTFPELFERVGRALPAGSFVMNIPFFGLLSGEERAQEFSASMDEIITRAGHHLIDIRMLSQQLPLKNYMFDYHAGDLFHPNSAWYEVWAQRFVDEICAVHGWQPIVVADLPRWESPIAEVVY